MTLENNYDRPSKSYTLGEYFNFLAQATVYFEKNERKRERKEISSTFAFAFEFFRKNALALAFVNVNANAANAFFFERVRCNPECKLKNPVANDKHLVYFRCMPIE